MCPIFFQSCEKRLVYMMQFSCCQFLFNNPSGGACMFSRYCFVGLFVACVCSLAAKEPGVMVLGIADTYCSMNKQALWLERYLPASFKTRLIKDPLYKISKADQVDNVIFFTSLYYDYKIPKRALGNSIFCAQSMYEATLIPSNWVRTLNSKFDFVTVPCDFMADVYRSNGVKIPVFVLPMGCFLEDWLRREYRPVKKKPFVFIASGGLHLPRKNHDLLIQAFTEAFGDSKDVLLKIQVRDSHSDKAAALVAQFDLKDRKNIQFNYGNLDEKDYVDFFMSGNCLVNISSAEGFSITPREALALGMPVIATNNSAQMEICQTGFVRSVPCDEIIRAEYPGGVERGVQWNPTIQAVKEALLDMYENYEHFVEVASLARSWSEGRSAPTLAARWATLLHPKKIILGKKNDVFEDILVTDSKELYHKYRKLMKLP